MNRILVLGASGFIGKTVCRYLKKDHMVFGTFCHNQESGLPDDSMQYLDIKEPAAIRPMLEKIRPDWIISCLRGDFAEQLAFHERLAEEMKLHPGIRLCYLSTANVFDGAPEKFHAETDLPAAGSEYGRFKVSCESMLLRILDDACVILRIPLVFGTDSPRIRELRTNAQKGAPIRTWTNLYVNITTDVQIAAFIGTLMKIQGNGIYHLGSTDWVTYDELMHRISERLGLTNVSFTGESGETKEYLGVLSARKDIPGTLKLTITQLLDSIDDIGGNL